MAKDVIGGFLAGTAFMYFADPNRGRRRRAIARDKLGACGRDVKTELDKAARDLWNRSRGVASRARSVFDSPDADPPLLVERVRTALGRAVSHPHAIHVRVEEEGRILLEGPVLQHELEYLLKRVRAVAGVKGVVNRLEVHSEPGGISSLQGGMSRQHLSEIAQQNWTPSLRVAAASIGGAALAGSLRNRSPLRWLGAAAGTALLARAIANQPLRRVFGIDGSGAIHFDKTIHIDSPVEEVYRYWSNFENFPKFMTHLKEVRHLKHGRTHWVAAGPAGISIPWDAEITEQRENQLLAWTSVPGSMIRTSGLVRFDKQPDGSTRVSVRMSYCPPAGVFGHAAAWLFGADPKTEMDDDLVRLKSLIEIGKTRAHGATVTRDQVAVAFGGSPQ